MSEAKRKRRGLWLLIPGLCLMAFTAFQLLTAPNVLQYIAAAPAPVAVPGEARDGADDSEGVTDAGGLTDAVRMRNDRLVDMMSAVRERFVELPDSFHAWTMRGERANHSFMSDNEKSALARLAAVGERYFDVHPHYLLSGYLPGPDELKYGDQVIALDIGLAIELFGISEPIDRIVIIDGHKFRVTGVIRHSRAPGEYDLHTGYIPLMAAAKLGIPLDSVTVSALPMPSAGAGSAFATAMAETMGDGDYYELAKEALRQRILLRLTLTVMAGWIVMAGFQRANRFAAVRFRGYADRLRREYLRDMMWTVLRDVLIAIAAYALLLACCWAIGLYAIHPVYIFTEWVPAVLVEWQDIIATFWDLVTRHARPVQRFTPELKRIEFYGILLRWALLMSLVGALRWRTANAGKTTSMK